MKFGLVPTHSAAGAILAHGVRRGELFLRKGRVLSDGDVAALVHHGIDAVTVARLDKDDIPEDAAAAEIAEALTGDGVRMAAAFTGRANLHASVAGVFTVRPQAIDAINGVDEAITIATLPAFDVVESGAMLATVKIIPYAVKRASLHAVLSLARALGPVMEVAPFRVRRIGLVSTSLPQTKPSIHVKNRNTLESRLALAGGAIVTERIVDHQAAAVANGIRDLVREGSEIVLIYSASAIADRMDVIPQGLVAAGGDIIRFGMPVDPGNLILLGQIGAVPVVGLPGCARSPKLNGFDWVLQRMLAGIAVGHDDIARMGVGGLLKEIPSRPQPRSVKPASRPKASIAAVVLAAGKGVRMGAIKQLAMIGGQPMLRRTVEEVAASEVDDIIVVTGHEAEAVGAALKGVSVRLVRNPDFAAGLSTSLKAGVDAVSEAADAVLIVLGDMPAVRAEDINRLIAAFDPAEGRGIAVPVHGGQRGNPVLWSRAYFDDIRALSGDRGARHLLADYAESVCEVEAGPGVLRDIDTPENLAAFQEDGHE